jgi:hypothetical protein
VRVNGHAQETSDAQLLENLRRADRARSDAALTLADFRRQRFVLGGGGLPFCAAIKIAREDIPELHRLEAARDEAVVRFQQALTRWAASKPRNGIPNGGK